MSNLLQCDYSVYLLDDSLQYITKDYEPVKRKIVTAANRHRESGVMLVGARHWSPAMRQQCKAMNITSKDFEQGFIDQYDQFITREDAMRIALKNGQPLIRCPGADGNELFSENLH
mgnify:CR=1 FL=1